VAEIVRLPRSITVRMACMIQDGFGGAGGLHATTSRLLTLTASIESVVRQSAATCANSSCGIRAIFLRGPNPIRRSNAHR
jgi:hypothetical protein